MIQTSTPKINSLSFKARHAKITNIENTINGDIVYTYEFSITVDTSLALTYDLTTLNINVKPSPPTKALPSSLTVENLNHENYISNTSGQTIQHLDTVGTQVQSSDGGSLTVAQNASLANSNSPPGFGGSFSLQSAAGNMISPNNSSTTLSAVLNFDRLYRSFLISKALAEVITTVSSDSVSVNAFIDTRVADNFKNTSGENSLTLGARQKTGLFAPIPGNPNTNFYTGAPIVKLVKPRAGAGATIMPGPNLTTVVNSAYGYSDNTLEAPDENYFERGPGNSVKSVNTQTGLNNRKTGTPKGVTNLDTRNISIEGSNVFLSDFRSAAVRSIFDFGIAPSSLIPVNVDSTVVSVMQNFQGTSNLKNNGS